MNLIKKLYCRIFGHKMFALYTSQGEFLRRFKKKAEYCKRCGYWKPAK